MMRLARRSIWTRAKHRVGLERPHFLPLARGQKTTGVAPAHPIEPAIRWRGAADKDGLPFGVPCVADW
jgi:hypothetical protein